jgi:hypothetical protein
MMQVVFTYLPIRLKQTTEIYLKYSIENLNNQNIIPLIYSDEDYFEQTSLKYKWIKFEIDEKYKRNTLWSYPKLKVLSIIDFPFIHLDNDLLVEDLSKLMSIIDGDKLNLGYKHSLNENQIENFTNIYKRYSNTPIKFDELNNTCIIATNDYLNVNKSYSDVLKIVDENFDFFIERYNGVPPITLNQQYINLYFNNINYLFDSNPSYDNLEKNGVYHMAEKMLNRHLFKSGKLI